MAFLKSISSKTGMNGNLRSKYWKRPWGGGGRQYKNWEGLIFRFPLVLGFYPPPPRVLGHRPPTSSPYRLKSLDLRFRLSSDAGLSSSTSHGSCRNSPSSMGCQHSVHPTWDSNFPASSDRTSVYLGPYVCLSSTLGLYMFLSGLLQSWPKRWIFS